MHVVAYSIVQLNVASYVSSATILASNIDYCSSGRHLHWDGVSHAAVQLMSLFM